MGATTRVLDRAAQRARRQRREIGEEFHERRLTLAVSQAHVAAASRMSRDRFGEIERGAAVSITIDEVHRIAAVLGMAPSIRVYSDGVPVRDAGHATRLQRFLDGVRDPVTYRIEVPLPIVEGRPERRAWDATLFRGRERCTVELEMRLRDVQEVRRRVDLKRRDDPSEAFLLLVADTRLNRRVLAEFATLFADLPRLRPSHVQAALAEGRLPPTGILLI